MTLFQRCLRFLNVLAAAYLLVFIPFQIGASADEVGLDVYFFYSDTCPHCARQDPLMKDIDQHNEDVDVHFLEVSRNPQV
ncbi:MAG: hypothetical protein QNJ46_31010 [Leptolyngbyaceae cyanobacterium MO_188.B28]|nr:hypothetical protein [Leptolyngbyaceae cyanobacterium MO_188.B28]